LFRLASKQSLSRGTADSEVTYNADTTISTNAASGEADCYSGIAPTVDGKTTEVIVVEGATLNIEGDLEKISGA